ncbi:MAG: histidine phosphatase family protein, partial [Candidatus Saccharibacteria bacterium]
MKLFIVRHGETIENAKKVLMGHHPGTLSAIGKKQAKALAKKLSAEE